MTIQHQKAYRLGVATPVGDTGLRKITPTGGDGQNSASGLVQPVTGREEKPCLMCSSFNKDTPKLIQYLRSRGMSVGLDGEFETPIAKDIPGMRTFRLNVFQCGFCLQLTCPVEDLATCDRWSMRRDLQGLINLSRRG